MFMNPTIARSRKSRSRVRSSTARARSRSWTPPHVRPRSSKKKRAIARAQPILYRSVTQKPKRSTPVSSSTPRSATPKRGFKSTRRPKRESNVEKPKRTHTLKRCKGCHRGESPCAGKLLFPIRKDGYHLGCHECDACGHGDSKRCPVGSDHLHEWCRMEKRGEIEQEASEQDSNEQDSSEETKTGPTCFRCYGGDMPREPVIKIAEGMYSHLRCSPIGRPVCVSCGHPGEDGTSLHEEQLHKACRRCRCCGLFLLTPEEQEIWVHQVCRRCITCGKGYRDGVIVDANGSCCGCRRCLCCGNILEFGDGSRKCHKSCIV